MGDQNTPAPPRNAVELFQRLAQDPEGAALICSALAVLASYMKHISEVTPDG